MLLTDEGHTRVTDEGLSRRLTSRQLTMIAMGGAIGVGLFLGSTVTIGLAGPAVILTYVVGAAIALVVGYVLAEMAVIHPQAGSFGVYAERYLSPWFGFVVRASYAFIQMLAIGAEVTAVAIYFAFWFPGVPQWVWVTGVSAALVAINTAPVSRFGEFEYWFALIKVVAIVAFIVVGLALVVGVGPAPALGAANLFRSPGGFLPHGWTGAWLALTLVITSYMGIEVIAVTAGEAVNPETSIPRAMRAMLLRLSIFYLLAIGVMLMMTPWTQLAEGGGGITGSPFVRAFATAGIPYAAGIMNLVVISAALSSANSNLYTTTRMLFSLSRSGFAPAGLSVVNAMGVPLRAVAIASGGMAVAILLAIYSPGQAFLALYGTAIAGMLFIWVVVLLTHLRFRASLSPAELARLPIRLSAHGVTVPLGIASLVAIALTTFFVDGLQYTVPSYLVFVAVMSLLYARMKARDGITA
jgi:L-asparagine transporter-like permease